MAYTIDLHKDKYDDKYSKRLFFNKIVPKFIKYPWYFWCVIFVLLLILFTFLGLKLQNSRAFLGLCLAQSFGIIAIPKAFEYYHRVLFEWAGTLHNFILVENKSIRDWFINELSFFEGSKLMILSGIVLAVIAPLSYYKGGYLRDVPANVGLFGYITIFLSAFMAGAGLYCTCCASRLIRRLGSIKDSRIRVEKHQFGILSIGRILFKGYFTIAFIWSFYTASALAGLSKLDISEWIISIPVLTLALPTFPIIVGTFFLAQIPLHERMIEFKKKELFRNGRLLAEMTPRSREDLTPEKLEAIKFLEERSKKTASLPEWPCSLKSLVGSFLSWLTTILPLILGALANELVSKFLSGNS